ncbi:uncharacterized protein LOC18440658 isoform X2 [Amborella trichopoda]|uniref:uncharacterized protein LOC18440658 isoform X2 n=1 Tax=Amborella trichopoda TaxID=13333 RepID=UPI0009BDCFF4|nr:uncharacterized protein LOC18440658 isoform X2 [Amborella trichopoda]|eukprot:XP_020526798.1 uncharacterized protein LOC18440658 isoform X2 [Amborella trichopoda]
MRSDFAYFDRAAGLSNHFLFVLVLGFARVQYTGNVENFGSKRKMEPPSSKSTHPPSIHQSDLDDEDDNVKQLDHCAILYLALQELEILPTRGAGPESMP